MRYAVIMAGGSGTRLWPLSRKTKPKQLLRIFGTNSLLDLAVKRLENTVVPSNVYVLTNAAYAQAVRDSLPQLPTANIIGEPQGRDTANAIGLAAALLARKDQQAVMGVFTSDQVIKPVESFCHTVNRAFELAEARPQDLITFGLKPTCPHTGLGYIYAGELLTAKTDDYQAFKVNGFKEKPSAQLAEKYCRDGQHFWNSGMFVWQVRTILDELAKHLPASYAALREIAKHWDCDDGQENFQRIFPTLQKISIDYAVMEKASKVVMVALPCTWVDLGCWSNLEQIMPADAGGNISKGAVEFLESKNNIVLGDDEHLLALIGLEDLVVVHSQDATLICHKNQAQKVKDLVARLEQQGQTWL